MRVFFMRGRVGAEAVGRGGMRVNKKHAQTFFFVRRQRFPRSRGRCAWFGGKPAVQNTIPFILFRQAQFKTSLGGVVLYHRTSKNDLSQGGLSFFTVVKVNLVATMAFFAPEYFYYTITKIMALYFLKGKPYVVMLTFCHINIHDAFFFSGRVRLVPWHLPYYP